MYTTITHKLDQETSIKFWSLSSKKEEFKLKEFQKRATEVIQRMKTLLPRREKD